jgi:hypothetical protein
VLARADQVSYRTQGGGAGVEGCREKPVDDGRLGHAGLRGEPAEAGARCLITSVPHYLGGAAQVAKPKAAAKKESAVSWPDSAMVTDSTGAMTSVFETIRWPVHLDSLISRGGVTLSVPRLAFGDRVSRSHGRTWHSGSRLPTIGFDTLLKGQPYVTWTLKWLGYPG